MTEPPEIATSGVSSLPPTPKFAPKTAGAAKRWFFGGLSIVLSAVLLYFSFRGVDGAKVADAFLGAHWGLLLLSVPAQGVGFFLASERSRVLLQPLQAYRRADTFGAYLSYFVANNLFPLRMGELVRVDYLARSGPQPHSACLAVAGVERIMDLLVLCMMFLVTIPITSASLDAGIMIPVASATLLSMLGALYWVAFDTSRALRVVQVLVGPLGTRVASWVGKQAERFASGLAGLKSPKRFFTVLALSVVFWATSILMVMLWARGFGLPLGFIECTVVMLFLSLGSMIPSAPSGVGTFHLLFNAALALHGVDKSIAATVSLVGHALGIIPWTVLGAAFVFPVVLRFWSKTARK